jgi:hypothetical protein
LHNNNWKDVMILAKKGTTFYVDSKMTPPPCDVPKLDYPVTPKENLKLVLEGKIPYWVPMMGIDHQMTFCPHDNDRPAFGTSGIDWFGVSWSYVEQVGGQMVTPNTFVLNDPKEWREKIKFPDFDQMDFTKGAEEAARQLAPDKLTGYVMQDGLFERLLSLCTVEDALSWLLTDPDDAADFFNAMADYKIALIHKLMKEWVPFDILINSDDWGTQISTFMSPKTFEELIYPPMKRIADVVHSYNLYYACHSCGKVQALVPYIADLGFHYWEAQRMNDLKAVKEQYGSRLAIQYPLDPMILEDPEIELEELRRYIRQVIDSYGSGGGLLLTFKALTAPVYTTVIEEIFNYSRAMYDRQRK